VTPRLAPFAAFAVGVLHFLTRARVPQGWDEVGFLRAVERFDLAAFQPHFPGYPVYVALCKLVGSPALVSAIASAATALALAQLAAFLADDARAAWIAMALWAGALQPWLLGGAALADATAMALSAGAFAALTFKSPRASLVGAATMALAVGTRLSYWPLAASFAAVVPAAHRRAALVAGVVATAAWLLPFVAVVGARRLEALGAVHVAGHFADWGGSIATRPNLAARAVAFARDLVYDGVWPNPWLLAAALAVAAFALVRAPRPSSRARALAAVVVVPYAAWALLAQNLVEQPRHLLPLVAALVVVLAAACARRWWAGAALAALAFASSAPLIIHRAPPAAVVVAHRVVADYGSDVVVFGRRSARLMQWAEPTLHVETRDAVSEVLGALERFSVLPRRILVTDELTPDEPARLAAAHESLRFCRDLRVDRQSPCVALSRYKLQP
jgi:hypothetical protein